MVFGIALLLFICSYGIVLQSNFEVPLIESEDNIYSIENEDIYIRKNADGSYEFVDPFGSEKIDEETAEEFIQAGIELYEE